MRKKRSEDGSRGAREVVEELGRWKRSEVGGTGGKGGYTVIYRGNATLREVKREVGALKKSETMQGQGLRKGGRKGPDLYAIGGVESKMG